MVNSSLMTLLREQALALYRRMLLIRRSEEQLVKLYAAGKIWGACHTYIGEEAVASGVCAPCATRMRCSAPSRARSCPGERGDSARVDRRVDGPCDWLFRWTRRQHAPVQAGDGSWVPAASSARVLPWLRSRLHGQTCSRPAGSPCLLWDGAVNNGSFHEGINMATAWDLPVLFVCENNLYATEVAFAKATRNTDIAARARA